MFKKVSRTLRAELRDIRVLFGEFKFSLLLFVVIILLGAFLFFISYGQSNGQSKENIPKALYAAYALIFFETTESIIQVNWYIQVLYFLIPILGMAFLVDGLIRFGTALVNKKARGQKWQVAMASTFKKHVIICGLGRIGYRIALELIKFDRDIVAIESNQDCRFIEEAISLRIPVIIADASRPENLIKANVGQADAIIPCTGDALKNLKIALDARESNPAIKVVVRMFDPDLAKQVEKGFGIHTAFSTSALAAPIFATAAMRVDVKHSFYVNDQLLNLSEVTINPNSQLIGWTVKKIESNLSLSFVSYHDSNTYELHPDPNREIKADAKILVVASLESLCQLNDLNQP